MTIYLSIYPSMSFYRSVDLSMHLSIYLSMYKYVYIEAGGEVAPPPSLFVALLFWRSTLFLTLGPPLKLRTPFFQPTGQDQTDQYHLSQKWIFSTKIETSQVVGSPPRLLVKVNLRYAIGRFDVIVRVGSSE